MSPGISPKSFESDQQLMVARSTGESLQGRGGCKLVFTGETSLYKYVKEMSKGYVLIGILRKSPGKWSVLFNVSYFRSEEVCR